MATKQHTKNNITKRTLKCNKNKHLDLHRDTHGRHMSLQVASKFKFMVEDIVPKLVLSQT